MHWFTADWHIWHAKIVTLSKRRKVLADGDTLTNVTDATLQRMSKMIVYRINERVDPSDHLWVLGDLCFDPKRYANKLGEVLSEIRCHDIRILWGNHDMVSDKWRPARELVAIINSDANAAAIWGQQYYLRAGKVRRAFLNHYPLHSWQGMYKGGFMLHGHCHDNQNDRRLPRQVDVGVDCWNFFPISMDQITQRYGHESFPGSSDDEAS